MEPSFLVVVGSGGEQLGGKGKGKDSASKLVTNHLQQLFCLEKQSEDPGFRV